ncbi:MAG: hypothetical protein FJ280_20845 [Planctomycetes bacterium]|nr:hypothetical protein [Planctomycetota bacterium]
MKWSQLRARIESLWVDSVRGRIQIGSTAYGRSSDGRGWITVDGQEIIVMTWSNAESWRYPRDPEGQERWADAVRQAHAANMFSRGEWHGALFDYLSMSMDEILKSDNPLIRAIGMLDARLGKRRLRKLDVSRENALVQRLYYLRCDAEGLVPAGGVHEKVDLTSRLKRPTFRGSHDISEQQRQDAIQKLTRGKKTRDVVRLLTALYQKSVSPEDLDTEISRKLSGAFAQTPDPVVLFDTLQSLKAQSKLLDNVKYIDGILALINSSEQWLRPFREWRPRTHNPDRQFSSLARHLFAEFDVPVFMDQAWLRGNAVQQDWFKHVARGGNIRTAAGLPIPLTKKMAHHFLAAPAHYSIEAALLWGQVRALGGDEHLADALRETRIVEEFRDNDFRVSVLRFFAANPLLDPVHIGPIIDYIWHEKYENRMTFVDRGVVAEAGPAQPNFSMRGRTATSLLRQVEVWHRQLGRESTAKSLEWRHSPIRDYQFVEGTKEARNMRIWRIRELVSARELISEGRQQHHCVATYAQSCSTGRCSIWTMEAQTELGIEKCVTIELHSADKMIRQVRGRRNRFPTEQEKQILQRWASQEGLRITPSLQ